MTSNERKELYSKGRAEAIMASDPTINKYTMLDDKGYIVKQYTKNADTLKWSEVSAEEIKAQNALIAEKKKQDKGSFNGRETKLSSRERDIAAAEALLARLKAKVDSHISDTTDEEV